MIFLLAELFESREAFSINWSVIIFNGNFIFKKRSASLSSALVNLVSSSAPEFLEMSGSTTEWMKPDDVSEKLDLFSLHSY